MGWQTHGQSRARRTQAAKGCDGWSANAGRTAQRKEGCYSWQELVCESDKDNARAFDKLSVANVRAIVRPISTGRPIIAAKLPNLRGRLGRKLEVFTARKITHGGKVPRARQVFSVVFHTGRKLKRDSLPVKLFFNLFLISLERSFESGEC